MPRTKRRAVRRKPVAPKKTKSMKSLVRTVAKKVIAESLEDKYVTNFPGTVANIPLYFNASIGSTQEVYALVPPISQGVGSNQRVGDKIRPKRLRIDFVITANGAYNSSQLNQVRLFILQDKSIKNISDLRAIAGIQPGTPVFNQLLDNGGGTQGFLGEPIDIMRRVNRQRYSVIKDKVMELCAGTGQTPQAVNGYNGTQTFVTGQQCYKLSFVIPTPAVLVYSKSLDTYPSNFAPFFCLGYVQPDGNALPDNILTRGAVNWYMHFDYEDA